MDAAIKGKWSTALRSGVYLPGTADTLRNGNLWSALGVLIQMVDTTLFDTTLPPPHLKATAAALWQTAGITQAQMKQVCDLQQSGKTFSEIADVVDTF